MKKEKKMKKKNTHNIDYEWVYITCGILLFFSVMMIVFGTQTVKYELDCSAELDYGTPYVDEDTSCWADGVQVENCPMPKKLSCKISGEMPATDFRNILKQLD